MAKTIGKYEVIRSLGSGAMGEVYLARQAAIGREVAIKTILPNVAKGEEAEGRFRREAESAGKLSHPNIVTIFDFDKDGDLFYLVMEFVKGDDLEDLIKERALSHSQFLEVLAQVCDGLSHAHRHGIIHRDIKPANVRVVRDGKNLQAKVMDFGIARMEDSSMTATGIVMGTVSYMAPEYIRGGHATNQSDLFAVGVMLYECLTGRKPFAGDNTTTILFKIVSDPAPALDLDALQGISHSIRHVLDKALSKDPVERFQTADDLAKALRACKDPSWTGTLDEATAMLMRHQAQIKAAEEQGTQLLQSPVPPMAAAPADGTLALPAPARPTMAMPAGTPPPAQASAQPTTVLAAVPAPPAAQAPSRTGLYATVGAVVLAAVGGGAWFALKSRGPVPAAAPMVQPAAQPAPSPAASPAPQAVTPAPPAPQAASAPQPAPAQPAQNPVKESPKPAAAKVEPKPGPAAPAPPKPEAPNPAPPEAPKPAAATVPSVTALLASDPRQAAVQAKTLVAADPGNAELQGLYLAALYQSRNAWDFERGLSRANASSVTVKKMMAASPAFKAAMIQESKLRRTNPASAVLSPELLQKIVDSL